MTCAHVYNDYYRTLTDPMLQSNPSISLAVWPPEMTKILKTGKITS